MKLRQSSLSVSRDFESSFDHCGYPGGPVKLVVASLSVRHNLESILHRCEGYMMLESSFRHCGGPMNLLYAWLGVSRDLESSFYHCQGSVKLIQASFYHG